MKRSDRHKTDKQTEKQVPNQSQQNNGNKSDDNLFSKYVSKDKVDQGKKFFSGKLTEYNTQLQKENKILKEKFTNLRMGSGRQEKDPDRKRPIIPIIVTGILLLPITILLAFLLITNFLPDENEMNNIATNEASEESEGADGSEGSEDGEGSEDTTDEETEVADEDGEESDEDVDVAEDIPNQEETEPEIQTTADYSSAQRQQLQRAAQNAVNEKNAELAERREQEALARQRAAEEEARRQAEQAQAQAEAEAQNETEEDDNAEEGEEGSETEPPTAGNAVHTVTAEDNLYRIAIQYYGDGSAANVQRIRDANGLAGDNLEVGQQLTIP